MRLARFEEVRIMGGGSKNRLLNQFTADATGRAVVAGPAEARQVIDRSFPVERFEPSDPDRWNSRYRRFQDYVEPVGV